MESIQQLFGVCERLHDGFWQEPLNAISNLAFVYAAFRLYRFYQQHPEIQKLRTIDIRTLIFFIGAIGVASFIFHTTPNYYTELLDIVFIVAFVLLYFFTVLVRVIHAHWFDIIICTTAYLGFTYALVNQFPNALNDSIGYLSTMTSLVFLAIYFNIRQRPSAQSYLLAALIGVISLFFRSIDNAVCDLIPIGTHFLWHTLNAILMYILTRQLILSAERKAKQFKSEQMKSSDYTI